jgi:hypothetical protein
MRWPRRTSRRRGRSKLGRLQRTEADARIRTGDPLSLAGGSGIGQRAGFAAQIPLNRPESTGISGQAERCEYPALMHDSGLLVLSPVRFAMQKVVGSSPIIRS